MKWQVENIGTHCNILEAKSGVSLVDQDAVGMGFPMRLAARIVKKHNDDIIRKDDLLRKAWTTCENTGRWDILGIQPEDCDCRYHQIKKELED